MIWSSLRKHILSKHNVMMQLPVLVSLLCVAALNASYTRSLSASRELVAHSLEVHNGIEAVMSAVQDVEIGQRGFLLTGDATYLDPYDNAVLQVLPMVGRLRGLVEDNPSQQVMVSRLGNLITAKLAEVAQTIAFAKKR
jgi:CHASE3 domain sensor protein